MMTSIFKNFGNLFSKIAQSKLYVFLSLTILNSPLMILTFDTTNWSDDFQLTNLMAIKAKFSPIADLLFNMTGGHASGGHFAPVYNLINIVIGSFTLNPIVFHFIVSVVFLLTGYCVYLIVKEYFEDTNLGFLASMLFIVNYYIAFKALNWNTFHSHATNTFTGALCLLFIIKFMKENKVGQLIASGFFLLLSICNYESGFVFFPVAMLICFTWMLKRKISFKKFVLITLVFGVVMALFPLGSYVSSGQSVPLSYRFAWKKHMENFSFNSLELFMQSVGVAFFYYKFGFNALKENSELKEAMIQLLRQHDSSALASLPSSTYVSMGIVGIFIVCTILLFAYLALFKTRRESRPFLFVYLLMFFIYVVIFYRVDIANATALFSSIIVADILLTLFKDRKQSMNILGYSLGLVFLTGTIGTILNKFDDCYQKSFFGISKIAVQGPHYVYNDINREIGQFAENGIILFMHDYSEFHRTIGFERIGDMMGTTDLAVYNASVYYKEMLETDLDEKYKDKTFYEFVDWFAYEQGNEKIIVSSEEQAMTYLKLNKGRVKNKQAIYISKNYEVKNLQKMRSAQL